MENRSVFYGDCKTHMEKWVDYNIWGESVLADLIYLDPPFNSNKNYNILFERGVKSSKGISAQVALFEDIWKWEESAIERYGRIVGDKSNPVRDYFIGLSHIIPETTMLAYLTYMSERLILCRSLLKDTGSIYLHCDPTASHYLKTLMDSIFGAENFRNEIVWHYQPGTKGNKRFGAKHDIILAYGKIPYKKGNTIFNKQRRPSINPKSYRKVEEGTGRRYQVNGFGNKYYLDEGQTCDDVWSYVQEKEMDALHSKSKERQGYKTQKTLALLKRIILASSNKGGLVFDPFCGCGTTLEAASITGRQFCGIDISLFSVNSVVFNRLHGNCKISGIPEDFESWIQLAKDDARAFERLAVERCDIGMKGNIKQSSDGGIDGYGRLLGHDEDGRDIVIAQVKSGKFSVENVRSFVYSMRSENAVAGIFISKYRKDWTSGMREIAYKEGEFQIPGSDKKYPRLQHWPVEKLCNIKHNRFAFLPPLANPLKKNKEGFEYKQEKLFLGV